MKTCPICQKEHDGSYGSGKFCSKHCQYVYIGRHNKHPVNNFPNYKNKIMGIKQIYGEFACEFCEKIFKTKTALIAHKIRCKLNPNMKFWNVRSGPKTFDGHIGSFVNTKYYKIQNLLGNSYKVQGSWEYNVALKLNNIGITWIRGKKLSYTINNIKKIYNPDFYLPDQNAYIEVKGYFSEKDKIKMNAVVNQNLNVKIYFMKSESYQNFINGKITIDKVPIYQFQAY